MTYHLPRLIHDTETNRILYSVYTRKYHNSNPTQKPTKEKKRKIIIDHIAG